MKWSTHVTVILVALIFSATAISVANILARPWVPLSGNVRLNTNDGRVFP